MTLLTFIVFAIIMAVLSFAIQSINLKDIKENYKTYLGNTILYTLLSFVSLCIVYGLLY